MGYWGKKKLKIRADQPLAGSRFLEKSACSWPGIIFRRFDVVMTTESFENIRGQNRWTDGRECRPDISIVLVGTLSLLTVSSKKNSGALRKSDILF